MHYHQGELEAQEKVGERTIGERNGRMVADQIIAGAIKFIEKQPFCIAGSVTPTGEVWASVLAGSAGYVKVTNPRNLEIDAQLLCSNPHDRFWNNCKQGSKAGFLFIEPATRRRYRINGRQELTRGKLWLTVEQAYPNWPKYIQQRHVRLAETPPYAAAPLEGNSLDEALKSLIRQADTFFVASASADGSPDASHRGGLPGFVHIQDEHTLLIPDYPGNSMYNTLGNFLVNPRAGLLFLDFTNHQSLQLTGTAQVHWQESAAALNTGGTGRSWRFRLQQWILLENLRGFDWDLVEYSPHNPS